MTNESVLSAIRNLFDACGPQHFDDIVVEVERQAVGVTAETAVKQTQDNLDHLIQIGTIQRDPETDESVYGYPGDF